MREKTFTFFANSTTPNRLLDTVDDAFVVVFFTDEAVFEAALTVAFLAVEAALTVDSLAAEAAFTVESLTVFPALYVVSLTAVAALVVFVLTAVVDEFHMEVVEAPIFFHRKAMFPLRPALGSSSPSPPSPAASFGSLEASPSLSSSTSGIGGPAVEIFVMTFSMIYFTP